jgi:hypothetical protein
MANSTLENLKKSGFVRTDPLLAIRAGKNLLRLPDGPFYAADWTCGSGALFYAVAHASDAQLIGVEISSERADEAREAWPRAHIVITAFEAIQVQGQVDLVLSNFPYMQQNGQRAPYRFTADATEKLVEGGINLSIYTARDWEGFLLSHWLKWYERIGVWKFPDRTRPDQEGAFDEYRQILVVGIRRKQPVEADPAEKKRLAGYHWKEPEQPGISGWKYGEAPPDIPETPINDPYEIPACGNRAQPKIIVRNADEATLLYALDKAGAHFSAEWQKATTWLEESHTATNSMPYTGEAHVAAAVMVGALDGDKVIGPDHDPYILTAFVGLEWRQVEIDEELMEKLRAQGCVHVEVKQREDKPILGVLNLRKGTTNYYQGEEVFKFLQPWLHTLASNVIQKHKPLYQLDPADWEISLLAPQNFGGDKWLPKAPFPGLAAPQMHRVFAMARSLDAKGRTAIQGEPGTGKTRIATASAARQAYRWRHRTSEFLHRTQPAWIMRMRRAWLKNPETLAMLGLQPVYGRRVKGPRGGKGKIVRDPASRQIVAYQEITTGKLIAPEDAGPKALPVLITTPLKVTKEFGREIKAAFPHAEVVSIENHRDIPRWLQQCAASSAPVVFGIFSHSTTRAFGREWKPAVREKVVVRKVPDLSPPEALEEELEPVYETHGARRKLVAYRWKRTHKILTKEVKYSTFYCSDCGSLIQAAPGKRNQPDEEETRKSNTKFAAAKEADEEEVDDNRIGRPIEAVTSLTFFKTKQRWCQCAASRRNLDRQVRGRQSIKAPLWQDDRVAATNRKHPPLSFARWQAAISSLQQEAAHTAGSISTQELIERVRRDERLMVRLVELTVQTPSALSAVLEWAERIDGKIRTIQQGIEQTTAQLGNLLWNAAVRDEGFLGSVIVADEDKLDQLVQIAMTHEPALKGQLPAMQHERLTRQVTLMQRIAQAISFEPELVTTLVEACIKKTTFLDGLMASAMQLQPAWQEQLVACRQSKRYHQLALLLTNAALQHRLLLQDLVWEGLRNWAVSEPLLDFAKQSDPEVTPLLAEIEADREAILALVLAVAQQHAEAAQALISEACLPKEQMVGSLVTLAKRDHASLAHWISSLSPDEEPMTALISAIVDGEQQLSLRLLQVARRDGSHALLARLIEQTRNLVNWRAMCFGTIVDRVHHYHDIPNPGKKRKTALGTALDGKGRQTTAGVRLAEAEGGPVTFEEIDLTVAQGYEPIRGASGSVVAYRLGQHLLVPIYGRWSRRLVGYVDQETGQVVTRKVSLAFRHPPADSFSPYHYLYRFYRGCVALSIVDESHNGRGRDTDIAHSHHFAMRAAQSRELTSGTHYGGDILGFYHYWFRFNPQFWLRLGFGWNDAEQALARYGVIQQWTKEYESDARKGSGQTDKHVSTVPAPGLSAKLIPGLLEDLNYLTVLDVGALMPEKREIPKGIFMEDTQLERVLAEVVQAYNEAEQVVADLRRERDALEKNGGDEATLAELAGQIMLAEDALAQARTQLEEKLRWVNNRDLSRAYGAIVRKLEDLSKERNAAARLAKGNLPRLFESNPCESPFEVYQTRRGDWGDKEEHELVIRTPVLTWDHLYPKERWLIEAVKAELAEQRRVMIYVEQVGERNIDKRLEWVLNTAGIGAWSLPHYIEAEDRQQAILDAIAAGHQTVIVPYRKVNEGLNLHETKERPGINTIIWYELAMNLFMYLQASQRAWRLGAEKEVRIYLPFYIGSAAHMKLRKLGSQSGAAAAFAGEPAKGELIKHVGADKTTLARLSASLEDEFGNEVDDTGDVAADLVAIEAAFQRRNEELSSALKKGREWFGMEDHLPERLAEVISMHLPDMWAKMPPEVYLLEEEMHESEHGAEREQVVVDAAPLSQALPVDVIDMSAEPMPSIPERVEAPTITTPYTEKASEPRPVLVFGYEEDIKRVRRTRTSRRRTLPKLKNPVKIKEIPVITDLPAEQQHEREQPVMTSLFDLQETVA